MTVSQALCATAGVLLVPGLLSLVAATFPELGRETRLLFAKVGLPLAVAAGLCFITAAWAAVR